MKKENVSCYKKGLRMQIQIHMNKNDVVTKTRGEIRRYFRLEVISLDRSEILNRDKSESESQK